MPEKIRKAIYTAVTSEDASKLAHISDLFRGAGNNYNDIFAVFKMACPWLDLPEYERLMVIADEV